MTDALRKFCVLEKELKSLKQRRKEATGDLQADRKSAREVLLDSMRQSGQRVLSAVVGGETWSVHLKQVAAPVPVDGKIADRLEVAWTDHERELREALEVADDVSATAVDFVLECSRLACADARAPPGAACKETLTIRKAPAQASGEVAPVSQEIEELLGSFVENGQKLSSISKELSESRKVISEARGAAERQLLAELQQAGEESGSHPPMQRVTLRDPSSGGNENYYLRVKPAHKPAAKKLTEVTCRRALKKLVDQEIRGLNLQGSRAIEHLCSAETGRRICEELRRVLQKSGAKSADAQKAGDLRLSLDRVRSRACGDAKEATRPEAGGSETPAAPQSDG
jgi:hypothetical protein